MEIVEEKTVYVLVNSAIIPGTFWGTPLHAGAVQVAYKGGYERPAYLDDADSLERLLKDGYESEKTAKAALYRLRKSSGTRYSFKLDPSKWELKKISMKKRLVFEVS